MNLLKHDLKLLSASLLVVNFVACASNSPKEISATSTFLNDQDLQTLKVDAAKATPKAPFDEFFKTSGIDGFHYSADKKSVYFLKADGKVRNIFSYSLKTRKIKQITKFSEAVHDYYVDPKGLYLYVVKDKGGNEATEIFRFNIKSGHEQKLTQSAGIEASSPCDISRDGGKLYYSQTREKRSVSDILYLDLKTLKPTLLAQGQRLVCSTLSPDEKFLGVIRYINNDEMHAGVLNLESKKLEYVSAENGVHNSDVVFAQPHTAFIVNNSGSDSFRLWKYDLDNQKLALATNSGKGDISSIQIGANDKLSFVRARGSLFPESFLFSDLFQTSLTLPFSPKEVTGVFLDRDVPGLAILTVQTNGNPPKYYTWKDGQAELFYDSNQSKLGDHDFAKMHSMLISSFDGLQIPTHFYIPNGTSGSRKRPAILLIHGGPDEFVDPEYSPVRQFIANQGFVVVMPNFRGSGGFGQKFQNLLNGDWGGAHVKDILAVADYVKSLGFVDSSHVYIAGGSFGGFSVMSLITQYPKVFRAAIDLFGPIEMATFVDSWPQTYQSHWIHKLGQDPRANQAFNHQVSPIYHLDQIQIPLQVQQGTNDIRVPKAQSDRLVDTLKKQGRKVEYIVFENEGHGFVQFDHQKQSWNKLVEFCSQ